VRGERLSPDSRAPGKARMPSMAEAEGANCAASLSALPHLAGLNKSTTGSNLWRAAPAAANSSVMPKGSPVLVGRRAAVGTAPAGEGRGWGTGAGGATGATAGGGERVAAGEGCWVTVSTAVSSDPSSPPREKRKMRAPATTSIATAAMSFIFCFCWLSTSSPRGRQAEKSSPPAMALLPAERLSSSLLLLHCY